MTKISASETVASFSKHKTALEALPESVDLTNSTAIVTGGNSGIGTETVKVLATAGCDVILCARNTQQGEEVAAELKKDPAVKGNITVKQLDLANLASVKAFAEGVLSNELATRPLNLLILNAGVMACPLMRTTDGFEMQIGTNHLGHAYLTRLLLPKLKAQTEKSRVVVLSSEGHNMGCIDLDDLNYSKRSYSQWGAYGQSKLANILFSKELARRLNEEGLGDKIVTYSLHPGVIQTNLTRHMGAQKIMMSMMKPILKSIPQGAATTITAATQPVDTLPPSGSYLKDCKEAKTSKNGQDAGMAKKLWELTENVIDSALIAAGLDK